MSKLIKTIQTQALNLREFNAKEKITELVEFFGQLDFKGEDSVKLFAFGRFLKKLGEGIESVAEKETLKHLNEKDVNMDISGMNISYREYYDNYYPKDKQLSKYEEKLKELDEQRGKITTSIKNRKEQLKLDGKESSILRKQSVSARL